MTDHLPTSTCLRKYWMTPNILLHIRIFREDCEQKFSRHLKQEWNSISMSGMHLWSWKLESDARAKEALKSESLDQPCLSSFNNFSDACRWHCFSYEKQRHLVIISKLPSLSLQAFVNSHLKISILALSRLKVLL